MLLTTSTIVCLFATAAARPSSVVYDQRQDGEINVEGKINMLFLLAVPAEKPPIYEAFNVIMKGFGESFLTLGNNITVIGSYPESRKPGHIGSDDSGVRAEAVIPGRRRFDPVDALQNDLKLQDAVENCGPDRVRDSVTSLCKDIQPVKIISEPELRKQTDVKGVLLKLQLVPDTIPS